MALYHQLKFPSTRTFIEYRSVSEWKGVVVISNFGRPFKSTALGSCLVCLGLNSPLHPDRLRGPPSFLHNGYRDSFPEVKRPGRGVDNPSPYGIDGYSRSSRLLCFKWHITV